MTENAMVRTPHNEGIANSLAGLLRENTGLEFNVTPRDKGHWLESVGGRITRGHLLIDAYELSAPKQGDAKYTGIPGVFMCNGFRLDVDSGFITIGTIEGTGTTKIYYNPRVGPERKFNPLFGMINNWIPIQGAVKHSRTVPIRGEVMRAIRVVSRTSEDQHIEAIVNKGWLGWLEFVSE